MSSAYPPPPKPAHYDPPPQYGQPQPQYGAPGVQYVQPGQLPMTVVTAPPKPDNHMAFACFVFWCCNWICGLCGIYYASQTDSSYNSGQYEIAQDHSKKARMWSKIGLILGIIEVVVAVVFIILWYTVLAGRLVGSIY